LVSDRASTLVNEGYLLSEDLGSVVDGALARWDDITKGTTLSAK
jgi:hypothetical protein